MIAVNDIVKYNKQDFRVHRIFNSGNLDIRRLSDNVCVFLMPDQLD